MEISEERIEEFKRITEKEIGKEISYQEASEGAHNLANFVDLLYELAKKDIAKKRRLKKEPDGFPVDGHYSCIVCYQSIDETTGWYDWYGQTCLPCRKAIKDGTIPTFVCQERNSFFSMSGLNYTFKIKYQTAKKYIREGKLHPRIVVNENGKPHEYIFLKKENPGLMERHTSEYKSIVRHRNKRNDQRVREEQKKIRAEFEERKKKWKLNK